MTACESIWTREIWTPEICESPWRPFALDAALDQA
jgi:hypothetical protein